MTRNRSKQATPGRRSWHALCEAARDATDANISRVTDRIWTGGDRGAQSMIGYLASLESVGITHVIDCRPEGTRDQRTAQTTRIGYLLNGQPDNGQKMPDSWFDTGVDFALKAMADPGAQVLAHCHMGINRGPSMALAILLAQGMTPHGALTAIFSARPIAQVAYAEDAIDWWQRKNRPIASANRAEAPTRSRIAASTPTQARGGASRVASQLRLYPLVEKPPIPGHPIRRKK